MNFQSFWQTLCEEISETQEFLTLRRGTKFTAIHHSGVIIVRPNKTKFQRTISSKEFVKVWNKIKQLSPSEAFNPINYQNETFHASYILALIKSITKNYTIE